MPPPEMQSPEEIAVSGGASSVDSIAALKGATGKVVKLFRHAGYGFIISQHGEVYFDYHSIVGARFDQLRVGSSVRFVMAEPEGLHGPEASTVEPV